MRDLQVPAKARTASYNSEQFVDLPCSDILGGPMPKIRLSRLAELAPDCVTAKDLPDEGVKVCSARLALAYLMTEERELLKEAPAPAPESTPVAVEEFAPSSPSAPVPQSPSPVSEAAPKPEMQEFLPPVRPAKTTIPEPAAKPVKVPAPPPGPVLPSFKKTSQEPLKSPVPSVTPKVPEPPAASPAAEIPAPAPTIPPAEGEKPSPAPVPPPAPSPEPPSPIPAAKKPFSLFPMFRRKEASDNKPSVQVPRGRIEIPKPKRPFPPSVPAEEAEPAALEPIKEAKIPAPKPSLPKPRFEPVRSIEPKAPAVPTPPAPTEPASAAATPAPELPKAVEMPELPILTPKVTHPPAESVPPAPNPVEASPAAEEKSKTEQVEPTAPASARSPEPATPAEPVKSTAEAPIVPPPAEPTLNPAAPVPEPPPAAAKASDPAPAAEEAPKPAPGPVEEPPAASSESAVLVETVHVSQKDVPPEIAEQDSLQAIFHTEEQLSVDRVLELCGNLPGIHSCVLSHGSSVIAAHNTPDSVDIVSLSAHALEMLKAMRASSAKMGIGAVPAVTVHSEKGPITFFHQDDLCLLVLHKDRAFVPGVREKLQFVMDELAKAKLPLRLGGGDGKKLIAS